jgi:hypothetical protein
MATNKDLPIMNHYTSNMKNMTVVAFLTTDDGEHRMV